MFDTDSSCGVSADGDLRAGRRDEDEEKEEQKKEEEEKPKTDKEENAVIPPPIPPPPSQRPGVSPFPSAAHEDAYLLFQALVIWQ